MTFAVDFEGWIAVEAKSREEAQEIFWNWAGDAQDKARCDYSGVMLETPTFECDGVEEV